MSLYSTWQYGWLELGFRRRYFAEALKRTGWTGERVHSRSMSPLADVLLARRVPAGVPPLEGGLHGLRG
jgi:hypothetical protein